MPTLAELRAKAGPAPLPRATRTVTLITGQHLVDESKQLREQYADVVVSAQESAEEAENEEAAESKARVRKAGQRPTDEQPIPPEAEEIMTRLRDLGRQIPDHQGEIGLVGITGGEWHRLKEDHPPREGNVSDIKITGGWCSFDALFAELGRFVATWDGEPVKPGDWEEWLAESIVYADRRELCTDVVNMYEATLERAPKSSTVSSGTESSESD